MGWQWDWVGVMINFELLLDIYHIGLQGNLHGDIMRFFSCTEAKSLSYC